MLLIVWFYVGYTCSNRSVCICIINKLALSLDDFKLMSNSNHCLLRVVGGQWLDYSREGGREGGRE